MKSHRSSIDTSLRERHTILNLLGQLTKESVSADELTEIGTTLRGAGRRALSPLFRRLWREKNGAVISRYTTLLSYFEDDGWLDQLIQITLTRKDLEEQGRSALMLALAGYGVDVSVPPFTPVMDGAGGPLRATLPRLLDRGEEGLIVFMEDFAAYAPEAQKAIVRELCFVEDSRVVDILGVLLGFDEPETRREVIEALGRVRFPGAARILRRYLGEAPDDYRPLAERSLRRLGFLGLDTDDWHEEPQFPFHTTWVSPPDASGIRCLLVTRWTGLEHIDILFMELHETDGMRDAWGWSGLSPDEYGEILRENAVEDTLVPVDADYVAELVGDALERSHVVGFYLPPEFYVRQRILTGLDLTPRPYVPRFEGMDLAAADDPGLVAEGVGLLDDWFFDGWFFFDNRTRLLADELERLGDEPFARQDDMAVDRFLERWCRDEVIPRMERIVRRLFLTADLMVRAGREERLVAQTLAVAVSLSRGIVPAHRHPFLRRWLLELIGMVREARAEGYAFPARAWDDEEDGEWD
ncbi:HEAT repeat domain-containing protein [Geobacter sp.]|uniref:HEAT repeat domain-containing protein n=1 Tax=Geobacter sp. TaxID=46610 RepID=UPI0027B8F343|nr:HEAT repeat domain-containing protein [Geobacter sp.]